MANLLDTIVQFGATETSIIDTLPDPFFIKDRERRFLACNAATCRLMGVPKETILGRRNADLFSGAALADLERSDLHVLTSGETVCVEEIVPDHAGHPRTYSTTKSPLRSPSGDVVGVIGYAQDITGRKRESEVLRIALRAAGAGSWDWTLDGNVFWSPEFYDLYGLDEAVAPCFDHWLRCLVPEDRGRILASLRDAFGSGASDYYSEFRIAHPRKGILWLAGRGTVYYGVGGQPVRMSGINYDITAQKHVEDALGDAMRAAERTNLGKTKFLAAASHDLRQPLQSAMFYAASLVPHVDETGGKRLDKLETSLETLRSLLDSLFDISRLDSGSVEIRLENFPIADLLDQAVSGLSSAAAEKGLVMRAAHHGQWVRSDRTFLGRILFNLLDNAIKYTEKGSVEIVAEAKGDHLVIAVTDTGIGIGDRDLELIWNEFYQVANRERDRRRGLGLGLSIVQRLASMLNHPIDVRSCLGQGSVFTVSVPIGIDEAPAVQPKADVAPGGGGLCLLLDDDPIVLAAIRLVVAEWGYDTVGAETFGDAMQRLLSRGGIPDVIIADHRLREGDSGIEAVQRLRAHYRQPIPALIVTGDNDPSVKEEAAGWGIEVLLKPVAPKRLYEVVGRMTAGRRSPAREPA